MVVSIARLLIRRLNVVENHADTAAITVGISPPTPIKAKISFTVSPESSYTPANYPAHSTASRYPLSCCLLAQDDSRSSFGRRLVVEGGDPPLAVGFADQDVGLGFRQLGGLVLVVSVAAAGGDGERSICV
ncbi:hypothetical protein [Nocardia salmonicida]|uniref:hypothetical protein n=1 Tax=Nocardia salmonicida TaxID=53431 RepID=UPI002E2967A4|nr:hypothetical protein [Nocardia salmonicida]